MFARSDGGNAGGVLALNADMLAGGARQAWMGYLYTPDVDATIAAIEADGGAVDMQAPDLSVGRLATLSGPHRGVCRVMHPLQPDGGEDRDCEEVLGSKEAHVV